MHGFEVTHLPATAGALALLCVLEALPALAALWLQFRDSRDPKAAAVSRTASSPEELQACRTAGGAAADAAAAGPDASPSPHQSSWVPALASVADTILYVSTFKHSMPESIYVATYQRLQLLLPMRGCLPCYTLHLASLLLQGGLAWL